jgi:putative transposase
MDGNLIIYAWCLLANHFHLLVRTGGQPISRSMKRLLTGYVVNFNLRHKRTGHLFHNRYKSIICEDDPHLLELTCYIHLNPVSKDTIHIIAGDSLLEHAKLRLPIRSPPCDAINAL